MYRSGVKFFQVIDNDISTGFYITAYIYDDLSIRYKLVANNDLNNYILYSPVIEELTTNDLVSFWIQKKNDLYLFDVYVNGEVVS